MIEKLAQHIEENLPFLKRKKLLIAISGGLDSVVLCHLLHQLNFDISLAHCNFNLRKSASDLDEKFVEDLGEKLNLKTFITHFDTEEIASQNKESIQIAARNLRYAWFEDLIDTFHFDYLLTAHHLDDSLETFLINLTRGTGIEGLTGIPVINNRTVRPLLIFLRTDIADFAKKNQISWREDASNASNKYLRNKIRHDVVPILKEINPKLLDSFLKTSENLKESQLLITDRVKNLKTDLFTEERDGIIKIEISKITVLSNLKANLYPLLKEYHFTAWDDIVHLLSAQSGKKILSESHELLKDRDHLLLSKKVDSKKEKSYFVPKNATSITKPITLHFSISTDNDKTTTHAIFLDSEKLDFPLEIRKWQEGDFFYPTGMLGKKKLSKFFKDEKYSLLEKESTWLLCSKNQIVWLIGKRQDRRFTVSKITKKPLKIVFSSI